jgi:hypothetical protein
MLVLASAFGFGISLSLVEALGITGAVVASTALVGDKRFSAFGRWNCFAASVRSARDALSPTRDPGYRT